MADRLFVVDVHYALVVRAQRKSTVCDLVEADVAEMVATDAPQWISIRGEVHALGDLPSKWNGRAVPWGIRGTRGDETIAEILGAKEGDDE